MIVRENFDIKTLDAYLSKTKNVTKINNEL